MEYGINATFTPTLAGTYQVRVDNCGFESGPDAVSWMGTP